MGPAQHPQAWPATRQFESLTASPRPPAKVSREAVAASLTRASSPRPCGAAIGFADAVLSSLRSAAVGWWGQVETPQWGVGTVRPRGLTRASGPRPTGGNRLWRFRPILPSLRCGRMVTRASSPRPYGAATGFADAVLSSFRSAAVGWCHAPVRVADGFTSPPSEGKPRSSGGPADSALSALQPLHGGIHPGVQELPGGIVQIQEVDTDANHLQGLGARSAENMANLCGDGGLGQVGV